MRRRALAKVALKSAEEISRIAEASLVIRDIFERLENSNLAGATTYEIDMLVEQMIRSSGGRPSFQTLPGYSSSSCISLNDEVVHAPPSKKKVVNEGDIVKIDIGVVRMGYFSDACRTLAVGEISSDKEELMAVTRGALDAGIAALVPGRRLSDIGRAIEDCAESRGYAVYHEFTGHGVGFALHEAPVILHYYDPSDSVIIEEGMVLAIEPVIGRERRTVYQEDDGWTVKAEGGMMTAQFEESVAVTADGPLVLT